MEAFLIKYGLWALVLLGMFEGDVVSVMAGVVAHLGYLKLSMVILIGGISLLAGDSIWYWIGRISSQKIKNSRMYSRMGPYVEKLSRKLGPLQLLSARFIYGTRIASTSFWGIQRLAYMKFLAIDLIGCLVWVLLLSLIGFSLSSSA